MCTWLTLCQWTSTSAIFVVQHILLSGRLHPYVDIWLKQITPPPPPPPPPVQLVWSFVLSSLDYYNATLAGLPVTHIACLQRLQYNAARLVPKQSLDNYIDFLFNTNCLQARNTCFSTFWRFSASVSLFNARHISAIPDRLDHAITGFSGFHIGNLKSCGHRSLQIPRTCCLELSSHWS